MESLYLEDLWRLTTTAIRLQWPPFANNALLQINTKDAIL